MDAKITLPPFPKSGHRQAVNRWAQMYDRPPETLEDAPNYSRWLSNIVAGLMQAKPPEATVEADWLDLSELVEDTVRIQASQGMCILRPVHDGEAWVLQTLAPERVAAVWAHRRMISARVWTILPDPTVENDATKAVAVVEDWDNVAGTVTHSFWRGDLSTAGVFTSNLELNPEALPDKIAALPAVSGALADMAAEQTERRLVPVVWQWIKGQPAPIFSGNENVIAGLERLWDQEQTDAEMARNRVAIDERMLGRSTIMSDEGQVIASAGFGIRDNVLALKAPQGGAQAVGDQLPFQAISFPDSLTQRDRIERRENALLEMVGINPQSVGRSVSGRSDSAAAKRADQQMTLQTVATPARKLSRALSQALTMVQALNNSGGDVEVTVYEGVRLISSESAEEARTLSAAQAASTWTLIATAHPHWSEEQIAEEYARMAEEGLALMAPDRDPDGSDVSDDSDDFEF